MNVEINQNESWDESKNTVPEIFRKWDEKKIMISDLYKKRRCDRKILKEPMTLSVSWFILSLFRTNHRHAPDLEHVLEEIKDLPIKPINLSERLAFILMKIEQFHAFIQLSELFDELEKLFYKQQMMEKIKKEGTPK